jgi:hypothetical protein
MHSIPRLVDYSPNDHAAIVESSFIWRPPALTGRDTPTPLARVGLGLRRRRALAPGRASSLKSAPSSLGATGLDGDEMSLVCCE